MPFFTINNTVLVALLQVGMILFGIMAAGVGGKFFQQGELAIPTLTIFLIRYGLALTGLPLLWIYVALRLRRNPQVSDFKKGLAFVSGFLLLGVLLVLVFYAGVRPAWQMLFFVPQPSLET